MLDIKLFREDAEAIKVRLNTRHDSSAELVDEVLECDVTRREAETLKQELQSQRKSKSKEIGTLRGQGEDTTRIETEVKAIGDKIKGLDDKATEAGDRQTELLLSIPNLPHAECPIGETEEENPEIKVWGEKLGVADPKDHTQLAEQHGLFDFEAAAKITGSGFALYKGQGARLQRALINFLLNTQTGENGYEEVNVPHLIRRESMIGTGQLPKFEEDMYQVSGLYLAPTAEVPVTNIYRDTILKQDELPIKMAAHTPCFRREAGSAGRDNKGIIRIHQFDKVELVQIVKPEDSFAVLEELTSHAESILQKLGLHYRIIELCSGDLGFSATKTYDIEVWAPGQGKYLEVSSCSNFGDYQARRMKLRYKDEDGKNQFCHTLNGSGTALPRLYVALLEQYQQPDGSILIPEVLQPYFGADKIGA